MRTSSSLAAKICVTAIAIAWLTTPTSALGQPTLRVRAETRLELSARGLPDGIEVRLTLRDDLGASISGASVQLSISGPRETGPDRMIRTGDDGRFVGTLRARGTITEVEARYAGDATHAATQARRKLDPGQAETRLDLALPEGSRLDLDHEGHVFELRARSAAGGGGLAVEIFDELDRSLARGHTDSDGRWRASLPSAALGPPGAGRLRARSAADARRADAQVELPVIRFRPIELTLETDSTRVEQDSEVHLQGRLFDSTGGLGRRAVGLFAAGRHWATRLTDDAGRYNVTLSVPLDLQGPFAVRARYESEGPGRPDAASAPVELLVEPHTSWSWLGLALPLLAMALLLLWGTRGRGRPSKRPLASTEDPGTPASSVSAGEAQGRRRSFHDLGGRVEDSRDARPLAEVRVRVLDGASLRCEARTDEHGEFRFPGLSEGNLTLQLDAEGYELSSAQLTVPHRGEWSRARVRLRNLRWQVAEAFAPVAAEVLGSQERAATRTHRETAAASEGPLAPEVHQLAAAVERLAYGADVPERQRAESLTQRSEDVARSLQETKAADDSQS